VYLLFADNGTADFSVMWWKYALCWVLSNY